MAVDRATRDTMAGLNVQHLRGELSYRQFYDAWTEALNTRNDDTVADGIWSAIDSAFDYQPGGPTAIGAEAGQFVRQCVALLRSDLDLGWRRVNVRRVHTKFIYAVLCLAALGCAAWLSIAYSWWIFAACWLAVGTGWTVEQGIRRPRRAARELCAERGPFVSVEQWRCCEHLAPSQEFPVFTEPPRSKFNESALGRLCNNVLGPGMCCVLWAPLTSVLVLGYLWPDYDVEWYVRDDAGEEAGMCQTPEELNCKLAEVFPDARQEEPAKAP